MSRWLWLVALAVLPHAVAAQGITTAAIQGTVIGDDHAPIGGATVQVLNQGNGRRWLVPTQSDGRFLLENVAVGGPYRIEVRTVGYRPETRTDIVLALGQRLDLDFVLRRAAVELAPVAVRASADPIFDAGRTGPSEVLSATRVEERPNLGRDFLALTTASPQVAVSPSSNLAPSGGITSGGGNRLLNAFQIDGGANGDPYTGRLPGRETLPRPISLEALQELQVLPAPFDVRDGGFAGGLVNAVTKSGTNVPHGSLFGYLADGALVGRNSATGAGVGFTNWEYGATAGGPIVRDRVHYFLSVDALHRAVPDPGPLVTDTTGGAELLGIGVSLASAARFQDVLRSTYALDPGTLGPSDGRASARDVFGKITTVLGGSGHLEVSHHYSDGARAGFLDRAYGQYALSSVSFQTPARANASRFIWTTLWGGRWSNDVTVSYLSLRDQCRPSVTYPLIRVAADRGLLIAGTNQTCPYAFTQDALEVSDNATIAVAAHAVTVGAHAENFHFRHDQVLSGVGLWSFASLDSLQAGRALHYERALAAPSGTAIEFRALELAVYAQDRWTPVPGLALTLGARVEVPVLPDRLATNQALETLLGADTGRLPGGTLLWLPRFAYSYDVRDAGRTLLRGGVGLFGGPPPYVWIGSVYKDDGGDQFLSCDGAGVPAFSPLDQPVTCASGAGAVPKLSFLDPGVRFPQDLKVAAGIDQRLPGGVVGTVDVVYAAAVHQWYVSDANLGPPVGYAFGEGGRPLYGTISATGVGTPSRRAPALGQVVRISDRSGDHSLAVSGQLRRQFGERGELRVLYAHTRAVDRMSLVNFQALPNLQNTPLDGTLDGRQLRTSLFEIPERVELEALLHLPLRIDLSLLYTGSTGMPFTYVVQGDANADGIGNGLMLNDIVYVPKDSQDIELTSPADWAALDRFISGESCLRRQRGSILDRNSCRNPWFGALNARVAKEFRTRASQSVELTANVYNVLNLVHRGWGQQRVTALDPRVPMLRLVGYDAAAGRGIYRLQLPALRQVQNLASRWQIELGVEYRY